MYSGINDPRAAQLASDAGASGLVDKLDPPGEIIEAIRQVSKGHMYDRYPVTPRSDYETVSE